VRLLPLARASHPAADDEVLEDIIRRAFSSRRKQLRNALRDLLDEGQMRALEISPDTRPDALTLEHYVRLANAIGRLQSPRQLS
jgi:16S rRNA (adenine1518-N6/adenine1519-N6)-dimethyltransferase